MGLEGAHAVPLHERADEVDLVGRVEFRLDFAAEARVAVGVGEKCNVGEWGAGADAFGVGRRCARACRLGEGEQAADAVDGRVIGRVEEVENFPDEGEPSCLVGVAGRAQAAQDRPAEVGGEDIRLIGRVDTADARLKVRLKREAPDQRSSNDGVVQTLRERMIVCHKLRPRTAHAELQGRAQSGHLRGARPGIHQH